MESIDARSDLTMIDNIDFEEKVDIETLVLNAEPIKIPKIELVDTEKLENTRSIDEERNQFKLKMEQNILKLYEELDKEKSENPMMDFRLRRSLKIRQFVEKINTYDFADDHIVSLKEKIVEITEEHKMSMTLNAKTMNTIVKIHEKALDDKTNELARIKQELQRVNVTNQALLQKIQELETNNNTFVNNDCLERNHEIKPFSCKHCDASFVQVHEVREHIKIHESILEDTKIKNCDKEAKTNAHVNTVKKRKLIKTHTKHVQKQKNEREKYVCSTEFETIIEKSDCRKRKFGCDICKKNFTLKKSLKKHISIVHEGQKSFKCEFCDFTFGVKTSLDRHLNSVHEKNIVTCSICGTKISRKDNLRKHIREVHEGIKKYPCPHCQHITARKSDLSKHVNVVHQKDKKLQ